MELQAESERIKRSKILHSEGEMTSKINIAQSIKREAIMEGQGSAQKITMEAESVSAAIDSIASALTLGGIEEGESAALKLRLSEQYLEVVSEIFSKTNVLMIPEQEGGQPSLASPSNVAQVIATYKQVMGK